MYNHTIPKLKIYTVWYHSKSVCLPDVHREVEQKLEPAHKDSKSSAHSHKYYHHLCDIFKCEYVSIALQ
jgi:hypothetical protein